MMSESNGVRHRLTQAAERLLYTSESDRPFEPFALAGGGAGWPYGVEEFARRIGRGDGPMEERTLDNFLARHIERADPADAVMQGLRPRFEALKAALASSLRDVRVFRLGEVEVDCFAVGDDGAGNLAGLHTVAVET
jgi:hypothetical protein